MLMFETIIIIIIYSQINFDGFIFGMKKLCAKYSEWINGGWNFKTWLKAKMSVTSDIIHFNNANEIQ